MTPEDWKQIKQVKGYETSDGQVFTSAKIAMLEQVEINLKESLNELVSEFHFNNPEMDEFINELMCRRSQFAQIFLAYSQLRAQAEAME